MESPKKISAGSKLFWKPSKSLLLDHHLFTEEEVFKFCIENEFTFPGYREGESIVFIANELEKSQLMRQLSKLQTHWVGAFVRDSSSYSDTLEE